MTRCFSQRTKMKGDDEGSLPMANIAFCLNQREDRQKKRTRTRFEGGQDKDTNFICEVEDLCAPPRARSEDTHAGIPTPS